MPPSVTQPVSWVTVDERLRLRNPHEHHFISILCSANDVE
jgi:hypothetical protein